MLQTFVEISTDFDTQELPREEAARGRRKAKRAKKGNIDKGKGKAQEAKPNKKARRKILNLLTYKVHALGDYLKAIWHYGTTDNYSTQVVSQLLRYYIHCF
jgi:hypothetical protein